MRGEGFLHGRRKSARTPDELDLAEAHIEIVRLGWGRPDPMYRQIFAARFLPEATQEQWRSSDELQRRSTSPENAWRFVDEFANIDVASLAPQLTVPTLIMCSRREPDNRFEESFRPNGGSAVAEAWRPSMGRLGRRMLGSGGQRPGLPGVRGHGEAFAVVKDLQRLAV